MQHRHQPVGACYQPEAVARSIVDAAEQAPRELWVGIPAIQAILATVLAPGLMDRYLASAAYEDQLSAKPVPPGDRGILFEPALQDCGARGRFGARAKASPTAADPAFLRGGFALAALGVVAGAFLLGSHKRTEGERLRR